MWIKRLALAGFSFSAMGLGVPAESFLSTTSPVLDGPALLAADDLPTQSLAPAAPGAAPQTKAPHEDLILLTVDKSRLSADLSTLPEAGKATELLKTFRIAIGKEDGDK
ncbi:MAG: hypothetical protein EBU49_04065, partial [Proteobacteria bacterium]|nr:hypothetical protein [Pseudomonadota bacterium]